MKKKAAVLIRGLDPAVVEALRRQAESKGRSLEAELRLVLRREVSEVGSVVGEHAPAYEPQIKKKPKYERKPPVRWPKKTPIPVKGKSLTEQLFEDRR